MNLNQCITYFIVVFALTVTIIIFGISHFYGNNCSPLQEADMRTCLDKFEASLTFLNPGDSYSNILNSWGFIKAACHSFGFLKTCLGESVIQNCLNYFKMTNPFIYSQQKELGKFYHAADFACERGYEAIKNSATCASKHCRINRKNCSTIESTIEECVEKTRKKCNHDRYNIFGIFLKTRECFHAERCPFCAKNRQILNDIISNYLLTPVKFNKKELPLQLKNAKQSYDLDAKLIALRSSFIDLSEKRPPVNDYIEAGFIPAFVECLDSQNSSIQFEAVLCLRKIANSDKVEAFLESGQLPNLVPKIITSEEEISQKIIEIFAILISTKPAIRENYMELNIVEPLLLSILPDTPKKIHSKINLILASMVNEKDWAPTFETQSYVEEVLPLLMELVYYTDSETLIEATKAFIRIKQGHGSDFSMSIEILEIFIDFLGRNGTSHLQSLILKYLDEITEDEYVNFQSPLKLESLKPLEKLLRHSNKDFVINTLNLIANFSTQNEAQIQRIFDTEILIPQIFKNFASFFPKIQQNAANLIGNIAKNGNSWHLSQLLKQKDDVISSICKFVIETKSQRSTILLLSAIYRIAEILEDESEEILTKFSAHGCYDLVQKLSKHKNEHLQEISMKLRHVIAVGFDGTKNQKRRREEL